jgi:hypothetical protein
MQQQQQQQQRQQEQQMMPGLDGVASATAVWWHGLQQARQRLLRLYSTTQGEALG